MLVFKWRIRSKPFGLSRTVDGTNLMFCAVGDEKFDTLLDAAVLHGFSIEEAQKYIASATPLVMIVVSKMLPFSLSLSGAHLKEYKR